MAMSEKMYLNHFIKIERTKQDERKKTHVRACDLFIYTRIHFLLAFFVHSLFLFLISSGVAIVVYRAVVWADFIQFVLMLFAIVTVVVLGANKVGGFANVWAAAERGGRLILFK